MASKLSREQKLLCELLSVALTGEVMSPGSRQSFEKADVGKVLYIAECHKVLPLLYDVLQDCAAVHGPLRRRMEEVSRSTVRQSYRLLFLTRYLVKVLEDGGVPVVVLKGCGTAAFYPVPELRKAGDIDLLVGKQDIDRACGLLSKEGYWVKESQHANHHVSCCSEEGIDVELHTLLAEPFNDAHINERIEQLSRAFLEQKVYRESMGVILPVPSDAFQALQLLLHILQHFLRAGFGLKLLCDWVVFWNRQESETVCKEFESLAEDCGVKDFARVVTEVCRRYLGLCSEWPAGHSSETLAEELLCDVFDAEEFGKSSPDRMVAIQGTGIRAYWREFHYQMKLNHPRASQCVLLWPALWVVTLAVFLRNNRKLKRASVGAIMRSAGRRSGLVQQMGLWGE